MTNQQLIEHLALQVRDYPRGGGQRPDGMVILQKGNGKAQPESIKARKYWPKDSTIPTEVAEILLGIQFDKKKVVASCFDAAEAVTRHFGWELTWLEDFQLGGYLISCLTKAGYYRLYNLKKSDFKFEYALSVRKKSVRDYAESDPYTSDVPFPPWTGPIDEKGKVLVKPSKDQLKRTVWRPQDTYFQVTKPPKHILQQFDSFDAYKAEMGQVSGIGVSAWVRAANKLETNAYRINQELLQVVNALVDALTKDHEATCSRLEEVEKELKLERKRRQKGGIWKQIPLEDRTIGYLNSLWVKQKRQDSRRKKQGLAPHPDEHKSRFLHEDQRKVRGEYWSRWYECSNAREATDTKFNDLNRTLKHANERLGDNTFYQRVFLDHRGRMYLSKSIVNYQSGDLQRGLVDFAEGKKVRKLDMKYLYLHLANLAGVKGDADTRETSALMHKKDWLKWGKNPVKWYADWSSQAGDDKWQFIRGCIELAALDKNPHHKSTLIAEIDQSTSCLQHVALIIGDRDLANRVNLGPDYNDIYQEIADNMQELSGLKDSDRRKLVKMALVPWTYGGNAWTACQEYHKSDMSYLKDKTPSGRLKLANRIIKAIEGEIPSAVEFRDEYQEKVNQRWERTTERYVGWVTSSDFEVHVYRQKTDERRVYIWHESKAKDSGRDETVKVTAYEPNNIANKDKIRTAMPPNFVHSIDASVMHFVLADTPDDQSYVCVHDALGTHIRNVKYAQYRFRIAFYNTYHHHHPSLILQGVHPAMASPDNWLKDDGSEWISPDFLREVYLSPHITS